MTASSSPSLSYRRMMLLEPQQQRLVSSSLSSSITSSSTVNASGNIADKDQDDDTIELFLCAASQHHGLDAIGLRWLTVMNVTTLWHIGTHSARFI